MRYYFFRYFCLVTGRVFTNPNDLKGTLNVLMRHFTHYTMVVDNCTLVSHWPVLHQIRRQRFWVPRADLVHGNKERVIMDWVDTPGVDL